MEKPIEHLKKIVGETLPQCRVKIDAPDRAPGELVD
jgi:hypothetical protein